MRRHPSVETTSHASCALGFSRLYDVVKEPDRVVRDAGSFFGDASSPVYRQVAIEVFFHQGKQGFFSRRAGCCLEWRGSKKYCSNCILLSREEQDEKFRKRLEARR